MLQDNHLRLLLQPLVLVQHLERSGYLYRFALHPFSCDLFHLNMVTFFRLSKPLLYQLRDRSYLLY